MLSSVITTSDLPNLAREINDAHRQVRMHAKGMLLEAKRAGEALLVAKQQCAHGEFLPWLKANCSVSQAQAYRYMDVAKRLQTSPMGETDSLVDVSIREFLGRSEKPKAPKANPFSRVDAEHVMKLQRLADSTANENEAAVAQSKLDDFASRFSMTAEEAVTKSRKELDLDWIEEKQQFGPYAQAAAKLIEKNLGKKRPDELVQLIIKVLVNHPETLATLKDYMR